MNRQKIYIVSWNGINDAGGVERVTYYMVQAWKDKYDVRVIDFELMKKNMFYRFLLGKHYALDAILASIYTNNIIHNHKGEKIIVVTQGYNAPFVKADLHFSHGTMRGFKVAIEGASAKWHFNQKFEREAAKRAKKIIAVGNQVKKELQELYDTEESKVSVLENCVDTDLFFPINKQSSSELTRILFVGRLEYRKGLNKLVQLAKYIEDKNNFKLIIAANNDENTEMFKKFRNVEVKVGLNRQEMNELYNSGDIMFFPSLYEGFGLVTIEALSAGIPVVGNNIAAIGDLYNRGQKGIAILQDDIDKDIDKIVEMAKEFKDYKAKLELHESMVENYSINIYMDKLRKLWD